MNTDSTWKKFNGLVPIDLMGFNDTRLNDAGELEVPNNFSHTILFRLGSDALELSRLTYSDSSVSDTEANSLYILQNVSSGSPDTAIIIDNSQRYLGQKDIGARDFAVYDRGSIIVGRALDATPELELSKTVSSRHMGIRLSIRGDLNFADLNSTNGTVVYLHADDEKRIAAQTRTIVKPGHITEAQRSHRWLRRPHS